MRTLSYTSIAAFRRESRDADGMLWTTVTVAMAALHVSGNSIRLGKQPVPEEIREYHFRRRRSLIVFLTE